MASMMRMRQAVLKALDDALAEDKSVIVMGEDVAAAGGPFKVTEGLLAKHGPDRVIDTPISEMALHGRGGRRRGLRHEAGRRDDVHRIHSAWRSTS